MYPLSWSVAVVAAACCITVLVAAACCIVGVLAVGIEVPAAAKVIWMPVFLAFSMVVVMVVMSVLRPFSPSPPWRSLALELLEDLRFKQGTGTGTCLYFDLTR